MSAWIFAWIFCVSTFEFVCESLHEYSCFHEWILVWISAWIFCMKIRAWIFCHASPPNKNVEFPGRFWTWKASPRFCYKKSTHHKSTQKFTHKSTQEFTQEFTQESVESTRNIHAESTHKIHAESTRFFTQNPRTISTPKPTQNPRTMPRTPCLGPCLGNLAWEILPGAMGQGPCAQAMDHGAAAGPHATVIKSIFMTMFLTGLSICFLGRRAKKSRKIHSGRCCSW